MPEVCGNGIDDNCDGQIDEGCNNKLLLSINDASVYEGAGSVTLTVSLTRKSSQAVSVIYKTIDGTAKSKSGRNLIADFTTKSGTLTIPANSLSTTITLQIANDGIQEPSEQFTVQLSRPVNAALEKGTGTVTILNGFATVISITSVIANNEGANKIINQPVVKIFDVKVSPNPSNNQFVLKVESNTAKEKMSLRVVDVLGKVIEVRTNIFNGQALQIGGNYRSGIYFVEVTQGKNKKQLNLIKL